MLKEIYSKMENGQCFLCGERGHTASGCPDLCDPLKEGFQGGGGSGGGGHSHDEDKLLLAPSLIEKS